MKHAFLSSVLICSFITPQVHAQTTNTNAELIQQLLAQIEVLKAELNKLIVAKEGNNTAPTPSCTFTRLLKQGTQGTDVTCLQNFLKSKGHFNGATTGYFGPQTKESVAKWQRGEGIVAEPWEYGNFGEQSRVVYTRARSTSGSSQNTGTSGSGTVKAPTVHSRDTKTTTRRGGGGGGGGSSSRDTKVPSLPRSFSADPNSATQIKLSWSSASDSGSGIKGYNIYREGSTVPLNTTPLTDTVFIDTGLEAGKTYTYQIEVIDNAGNKSERTSLKTVRTENAPRTVDVTAPTTPGQPTVSLITEDSLRITWSPSTDTGGSNLSGYKLYRNGVQIATPLTALFNDSGLIPATSYTYTVVAYDGAGNTSATGTARTATTLAAQVATPATTPVTTSAALDSVLGTLVHDGPAVLEQIALYLPVTGSLPQTATAEVRYKPSSSSNWIVGHPLHRIQPDFILTHYRIQKPPDAFAWPIIDVRPGTSYDIEVTVKNGTETAVRTLRHTTRSLPPAAGTPNKFIRTGASAATIASTLNGLNPGDVLEIEEGTYVGNFTLARRGTPERPIYIRGKSRNGTILTNTTGNTLTLTYASDIILENLTLRGPGIEGRSGTAIILWDGAPNQDRITVRNVTIQGTDLGIKAWRKISEFLAYDNTLVGNNLWTTEFIDTNITWGDDGINVAGTGNAVFNNTLKGFGDTLALDPQQLITDSRSVHFYRNEILSGGDDGFEADGAHRNITFYDNRLTNTMTMISLDPVVGGPLIAARNISVNTGRSPIKMNNTDTGHFLYNNTIIRTNDKTGWGIAQPNNGYLRSWGYQNNILIYNNTNTTARLMAMEPVTQNPIDFTHNSWYPDGSIWWSRSGGSFNNLATTYARLPTTTPVFSGSTKRHEQDHILPNGNPWTTSITLGPDYNTEVTAKHVPTLASGNSAKNSGTVIPNITDGYTGSAPDRGAVISGRSLSVWGDRTGVVLPVSTPVVPVTPITPVTPTTTTPVTPTVPVATPTPTPTTPVQPARPIPPDLAKTVLGQIASALKPGEYTTMPNNLSFTYLPMNYSLFYWGDSAAWDSVRKEIVFVAGPGACCAKPATYQRIVYNLGADEWTMTPTQWAVPGHGYDGNAFNPNTGEHYFFLPATAVYAYKDGVWKALPDKSGAIASSLSWFPDINNGAGGLIYVNGSGKTDMYDGSTWTKLPNASVPWIGYNVLSEYNPVHKVVWIIGGTKNYKLDKDLRLTQLKDAPFEVKMGASYISVDPLSGKYIVSMFSNGTWWEYDIVSDAWTEITALKGSSIRKPSFFSYQVPIPELGVIVLIHHYYDRREVVVLKYGKDPKEVSIPNITLPVQTDTIAPVVTTASTSQTLPAGTKNVTLTVTTNEKSTCRFSSIYTSLATKFSSMQTLLSTSDFLTHTIQLTGLTDGSVQTSSFRCADLAWNLSNLVKITTTVSSSTPVTTQKINSTPLTSSRITKDRLSDLFTQLKALQAELKKLSR